MSSTPPEAPSTGPTGPGGPGGPHHDPAGSGPRVTRDEVRDLARLRRSRSDRKVSGVAGGIARHLDIDPLLVRVAFVVLTFFGGGGLILYGVAWLLVPEEDTGETVIRVDEGVRTAALIVGGIIAVASVVGDTVGGFGFPWPLLVVGLVLLVVFGSKEAMKPGGPTHPWLRGETWASATAKDAAATGTAPQYDGYRPGPPPPAPAPPAAPAPPTRRGPILFWFTLALAAVLCGAVLTVDLAGVDVPTAAYPATVLATCGLMLLVGAFYGRAGGLILIGLLAVVATVATTVAPDLSAGERERTPRTAAAVQDEELGIGEMRIDLTRVADLENLNGETLELEMRVGRIEVVVPDTGLTVEATGEAHGIGEIRLFGDKTEQRHTTIHDGGEDAPVLTIDADLWVGEIVIHTEEEAA